MVSLGIGSNLKILRFVILSLDRVQFANGFGLKKKNAGLVCSYAVDLDGHDYARSPNIICT